MSGRRTFDPADAVVWATAVLLALLCGAGGGFALWSMLSSANAPPAVSGLVYALALLVGFVVPLRRKLQFRLVVALAATALVIAFSLGHVLWAPLLAG